MRIMTRGVSVFFSVVILSCLVSANIENSASLSLSIANQDPDPALAGDIVEVHIGVRNSGGEPANRVVIELDPEYPFELLPGSDPVKKIGTIQRYQGVYSEDVKIVKYKVRVDKDATAGDYDLKVKYYEEGSRSTASESLSIDVKNREGAEIVYIDQVELIPGKITPLKFIVNNVGDAPLRHLRFHWENEEDIVLPVGSDNTKHIKYVDVGDSAELSFNVIASASANPNLYKLDLILEYQDTITGNETEIRTKAGVYVGGATDFDAAFSGISNGKHSFAISNIGSVSASSVTVKVPDQDGWDVSGSDSTIIGNLNKGDYTIASFGLQRSYGAAGEAFEERGPVGVSGEMESAPLKLEISYTDSRGNRNAVEKEVLIDSSDVGVFEFEEGLNENKDSGLLGGYRKWALIGVMVLAVLLVRRKYKRGRLKDQDYTYGSAVKDVVFFMKRSNGK